MSCNLWNGIESKPASTNTNAALAGTLVSSLHRLKDSDNSDGGFFVFGDLSIKMEGLFRLQFNLFEMRKSEVILIKSVISDAFHVHAAKNFPGMSESTFLTRSFSDQGVRLRLRKEPRALLRKRGPASEDYQPRHYNTQARRQSQIVEQQQAQPMQQPPQLQQMTPANTHARPHNDEADPYGQQRFDPGRSMQESPGRAQERSYLRSQGSEHLPFTQQSPYDDGERSLKRQRISLDRGYMASDRSTFEQPRLDQTQPQLESQHQYAPRLVPDPMAMYGSNPYPPQQQQQQQQLYNLSYAPSPQTAAAQSNMAQHNVVRRYQDGQPSMLPGYDTSLRTQQPQPNQLQAGIYSQQSQQQRYAMPQQQQAYGGGGNAAVPHMPYPTPPLTTRMAPPAQQQMGYAGGGMLPPGQGQDGLDQAQGIKRVHGDLSAPASGGWR